MLVVVDNFDSFTYNIVQLLWELGARVRCLRNSDQAGLERWLPEAHGLVIGPGPGAPSEAGLSRWALDTAVGKIPVLGICLGHQLIAEAFGGCVRRAKRIVHGMSSSIIHDNQGLFEGVPQGFNATRYHSLVVEAATLPGVFRVSGATRENEIMAISHTQLPVYGVQFHPESIASEHGRAIFSNYMEKLVPR